MTTRLLLILVWLCILPACSRTPESYVKSMVIDPIPESMMHVKTLLNVDPALGDGACIVAYTIDPEDCDRILAAGNWKSGLLDRATNPQVLFESVWPNSAGALSLFHTGSEYPWADLIVSEDRTRLILLVHE